MRYSFGARLLGPEKGHAQRARILPILSAALEAVDPYAAVRRVLRLEGRRLSVGGQTIDLERVNRAVVIGAGKAGAPMARAVEDVLGESLAAGAVNVKRGHAEPTRLVRLTEAGHPIPDQAGLEGTARLVALAEAAGPDDLLFCVISGGGSALLQLPAEGISLADTQRLTDLLLRAGATINELNTVRKHLSRVTGGGLARLAQPARVVSLILSDVVGNPLDVIASGPTVPDTTSFADAQAILRRFQVWDQAPASVRERLEAGVGGLVPDTPKPGDPAFERVCNVVVASNDLAAEAAVEIARQHGFAALLLTTYLEGEAREVGRVVAALGREIAASGRPLRPPCCLVLGGETTVTVRGPGRGGRNQELALAAALPIAGLQGVSIVSLATDGNDGPTDAAGALVDGTTLARARELGLDPYRSLADNDSYSFFEQLGDLLLTGPTNTYVNDLAFVFAF